MSRTSWSPHLLGPGERLPDDNRPGYEVAEFVASRVARYRLVRRAR